jgi:hypothetical protein
VVPMSLRAVYGLMIIVTVAWLLILGESYFFIVIVRPLGPNIHSGFIPSSVAKVLLTAGLGFLWVGVMFAMDSLYARFTRTPTSAS